MAYTGTYIFAERTVRITSLFERVHKYCADYRCEDVPSPDITVNITAEDIAEERVKLSSERAAEDYIEELAVYRCFSLRCTARTRLKRWRKRLCFSIRCSAR